MSSPQMTRMFGFFWASADAEDSVAAATINRSLERVRVIGRLLSNLSVAFPAQAYLLVHSGHCGRNSGPLLPPVPRLRQTPAAVMSALTIVLPMAFVMVAGP